MPRSRTPSRGRVARTSRSRSRGRQSPARASRSPARVARSPGRSPARVARSPGRPPARVTKAATRVSRSPPARVTRSRSPARVAAAPLEARPAVRSVTPPPASAGPPAAASLLTSTPKSEVRARRPLTRTAAVPVATSPEVLIANNARPSPEKEVETKEDEPAALGTRHSARIANKLRELGIDPNAGGDTAKEPASTAAAAAEEELKPKRDNHVGWVRALMSPMVVFIALLPLYMYSACTKKQCVIAKLPETPRLESLLDPAAFLYVSGFLAAQLALALLPVGRVVDGQISKQGMSRYRCNGFFSLLVTVGGVLLAYYLGYPVLAVLGKLRPLLVASALTALLLAPVLHLRARSAHLLDLNAAGDTDSLLVNLAEGRELSPRLFGVDLKLLLTRVCCVAVVLLAVLLAMSGRAGRSDSSPTLLLAAAMVVGIGADHMWFEDNLLTTYTFMNEGLGLKKLLALMMMPFFMTFNLRFIKITGTSHPWYALVGCGMLYLVGYLIQRSSNSQKNEFRKNPVNPALAHLETIPTTKGKKLLVSGWWGVVRHPNHLGGLLMIVAMSLLLGFHYALAWVLPACACLGVVLQARRVDAHCRQKYGAAWERYAARVRYRLIPSVF